MKELWWDKRNPGSFFYNFSRNLGLILMEKCILFTNEHSHCIVQISVCRYLVEKRSYLALNDLSLLQHFLAYIGQVAGIGVGRYAKNVWIHWPFEHPVLTYDKL